ncbi:MAG: hypothetical protein KC619_34955 [Myxococcales bacterium]|nr:hypothetical protein [Myxococcales bacterium]
MSSRHRFVLVCVSVVFASMLGCDRAEPVPDELGEGHAAEPPAASEEAAPTSGDAPSAAAAACGAYYDRAARRALASLERDAASFPNARGTIGYGQRSVFVERCGALPSHEAQCYSEQASAHRAECMALMVHPPPSLQQIEPLALDLEEMRALVASLPPAP